MIDGQARQLHVVEDVVKVWAEPGLSQYLHATVRREVGRLSPPLAAALDRLAGGCSDYRDEMTRLAAESVAGSLLALYGRCVPDAAGGVQLDDGENDTERWRKATVIVDELVRAGLI